MLVKNIEYPVFYILSLSYCQSIYLMTESQIINSNLWKSDHFSTATHNLHHTEIKKTLVNGLITILSKSQNRYLENNNSSGLFQSEN